MKKPIFVLVVISIIAGLSTHAQSTFKTSKPKAIHLQQNPFMPMNILMIPGNIEGLTAQEGDLVMAFNGEVCVGAAIVERVDAILNMVATGTDEQNAGFKSGATIRLEYHATYDQSVYELSPGEILLGSMQYEELGTLYAVFKADKISEDALEEFKINVYPNPVSHQLHIVMEYPGEQEHQTVDIRLYSIRGDVVHSEKSNTGQSVVNLDMGNLPTGEYTMVILVGNQKHTHKIIKQ